MERILQRFERNKKNFRQAVKKLNKGNPASLDQRFKEAHDRAFEQISCLDCARCCRNLGPLIRPRDVQKIAKVFSMKENKVIEEYLRVDEDGDYVFKQMPCPFLADNNYCICYEERPDACRRYPYTDQRRMKGRLNTLLKDASICPAVVLVLEDFMDQG